MPAFPGGLDEFCLGLDFGPGEVCIEFPGGSKLCASFGYDIGDFSEIFESLLGDLNAALMPLQPIFDIFEMILAIVNCIKAIPDTVGPPPDPGALLGCIPNLIEQLNKILALLPPFTIPKLIKSILTAIIVGLIGLRRDMAQLLRQLARQLAAALKAEELGNLELQAAIDCESANFDIDLDNANAQGKPLNRLIAVINVLLALAGLPCIQVPLGDLTAAIDDILAPIDAAIAFLTAVRDAIPVPDLLLEALPSPQDRCD